MKFGSGKANLISGCVLAINPPAIPQKKDISKKIFFLESKKVAAQIAVEYWKSRVAPKVSDWTDIRQVTKPINSGLHGLEHRQVRFDKIAKGMGLEV